jgi:hypothetical protein
MHFFSVAVQPKSGLDRLTVEVSGTNTIRHTHLVELLRKINQLVAQAATYTATKKLALSGTRTLNPSNQATADFRFRRNGYWDRLNRYIFKVSTAHVANRKHFKELLIRSESEQFEGPENYREVNALRISC